MNIERSKMITCGWVFMQFFSQHRNIIYDHFHLTNNGQITMETLFWQYNILSICKVEYDTGASIIARIKGDGALSLHTIAKKPTSYPKVYLLYFLDWPPWPFFFSSHPSTCRFIGRCSFRAGRFCIYVIAFNLVLSLVMVLINWNVMLDLVHISLNCSG